MKKTFETFLIFFIICFLGFILQHKYINEFPSSIHAWAQSDRYALSLGFVDNDLNFFRPQTYVMNHQFPGDFLIPSNSRITAVDFPIHDYIPAICMKISGTTSPWIFRLYILLYSFIGLFYLYKLSRRLNNDIYKSILIVLFAATSPVFVYYQAGFLPTIPSLANAIVGIFFYVKHLQQKRQADFYLGICFLTLSTLSRTTFAIALFAVLCLEFLLLLKEKKLVWFKVIPVLLSVSSICCYYVYNAYLRSHDGSIFLNHFIPASNCKEAIALIKDTYRNWGMQYFSQVHYLLTLVIIIIAFFFIFKNKYRQSQTLQLHLLLLIMLAGCALFAILMLKQFPAHDYYFLDTFFLPMVLLLTMILAYIPTSGYKHSAIINSALLILIAVPLILNAVNTQKKRRDTGYWDRTAATIANFNGAEKLLDSLKIGQNAKMLVIGSYTPNIPFILMNRSGFAIISTKREFIKQALNWKYDYMVFQNSFFISDIYTVYPEFINSVKKISDNGKITICTLLKTEKQQDLLGFLDLNSKTPVLKKTMTFDTITDSCWQNININTTYSTSGSKSGFVTPDMDFGLTYKSKEIKSLQEKERLLLFSSCFLKDTLNDIDIVVSINAKGRNLYYYAYNLKDILKKRNTWEKINLTFQLPQIETDDYEFGIYLYNKGRSYLYFDDFTFSIY